MTDDELRTWINSNVKKKVTATVLNEAFHKLIDRCAHIDNPLNPYTETISNIELDANKSKVVNHVRATLVPDFLVYDENGIEISDAYFDAVPIDANNIRFTFNDVIPTSGNGYYKVVIWKIIYDVELRYTELLNIQFTSESDLDYFTYSIGDSYSINVLEGKLNIGADYLPMQLLFDYLVTVGAQYRISIKIDTGSIKLINVKTEVVLTTGIYSLNVVANNTHIGFQAHNSMSVDIDYIILELIT